MKLYLARHARIDPAADTRHLTLVGRQLARAVGTALAAHGDTVDAVFTAPDVACVQTAELLADRLDHLGEVRALVASLPARAAAAMMLSAGASVLLVGEEPWLASVGAFLVGAPSFPPAKPAQVSLVEDGRPVWTYDPEVRTFATLHIA